MDGPKPPDNFTPWHPPLQFCTFLSPSYLSLDNYNIYKNTYLFILLYYYSYTVAP